MIDSGPHTTMVEKAPYAAMHDLRCVRCGKIFGQTIGLSNRVTTWHEGDIGLKITCRNCKHDNHVVSGS